MKTLGKKLRKTLPENIKLEVIYAGTKLESQFNIIDPIPKRRNCDIIYHNVFPEANCNEDYIGECVGRLEERTKDQTGRDKNSHMLCYSVQGGHNEFRI